MVQAYLAPKPLQPGEVENHERGIVFAVDKWARLRRFLILGSVGGTFYVGQETLTEECAGAVKACLDEDARRVVTEIVAVSHNGLAPSNEPALFALALAASHENLVVREVALSFLNDVARTSTHLFHFLSYCKHRRGWGRQFKRAIGKWYTEKAPDALAYQLVKYKQRDGYSHADVLNQAHPKPPTRAHDVAFAWAVGSSPSWAEAEVGEYYAAKHPLLKADDWLMAHTASEEATAEEVVRLIRNPGLPREAVPSQWLNDPLVWEALLYQPMPMTALLRNLGKLASVGVLTSHAHAVAVAERLTTVEALRKARLHPLAILVALRVYAQGHGDKGKLVWTPNRHVIDALDAAFYLAFQAVEPTNQRICLALDVSPSMGSSVVAGLAHMSPREAACALALVTMRTEPQAEVVAYSDTIVPFPITPSQRLDDVIAQARAVPWGGTVCSLPFVWAYEHKRFFDAFVSYTDSETFDGPRLGRNAPTVREAVLHYRRATGLPTRHAVVAMTSNGFSLADPTDSLQLDVVGMDTSTPQLLAAFIKGDV